MPITDLPNELIVSIAEHIEPFTCFDFAFTSKELWTACRSLIERHKNGFLKYRTFNREPLDASIANFLKELILDPRKAVYVQQVNVLGYWMSEKEEISVEDQDLFVEAARRLHAIYSPREFSDDEEQLRNRGLHHSFKPDVAQDLEEGITRGECGALLALLVHFLPELKRLRLIVNRDECRFEALVHRVALEYHEDFVDKDRLPFQRLETVSVEFYDYDSMSSASWALAFVRIPSLRTFVARCMGGDVYIDYDGYDEDFEENDDQKMKEKKDPVSNVTELFLYDCRFSVEAIERIIASTKALERFTYYGVCETADEYNCDPRGIIKFLDDHASHSLDHLMLLPSMKESYDDFTEEDNETAVSFRNLNRLKVLSSHSKILFPEPVDLDSEPLESGFFKVKDLEQFDIPSILPDSLEELYLRAEVDDAEWTCMKESLELLSTAAPNIHSLRVDKLSVSGGEITDVFGDAPVRENLWKWRDLFGGYGWK